MSNLLSANVAAQRLKCHKTTVIRACNRAGIEPIAGRFLLTESQFKAISGLIQKKSGNPNFIAGNHFGRPPKKKRK